MQTIIADMTEGIDKKALEKAGEILRTGGLVAFPTETVYGLGANALDAEASAKIYAAKGRPSDNPLIVHIAGFLDLYRIAQTVSEKAKRLAKEFWPGPLTMIFEKTGAVPTQTTGGLNTVAVRMPKNDIALALIRAGGGYIAAPSANTSGRPSPTKASHVAEDLSGKIEMILDGGPVGIGVESTIVDMSVEPPMILRPGYINREMLEKVIGPVTADPTLMSVCDGQKPKAPGMKYRHYAPKAPMVIVEGEPKNVIAWINKNAAAEQRAGGRPGVLASEETKARYACGIVRSMGSRKNELEISRHLYGVLRDFDAQEVSRIYSEAFHTPRLGPAIMNRLLKAAGHQVIAV